MCHPSGALRAHTCGLSSTNPAGRQSATAESADQDAVNGGEHVGRAATRECDAQAASASASVIAAGLTTPQCAPAAGGSLAYFLARMNDHPPMRTKSTPRAYMTVANAELPATPPELSRIAPNKR